MSREIYTVYFHFLLLFFIYLFFIILDFILREPVAVVGIYPKVSEHFVALVLGKLTN